MIKFHGKVQRKDIEEVLKNDDKIFEEIQKNSNYLEELEVRNFIVSNKSGDIYYTQKTFDDTVANQKESKQIFNYLRRSKVNLVGMSFLKSVIILKNYGINSTCIVDKNFEGLIIKLEDNQARKLAKLFNDQIITLEDD